jgi:glycosyltransferase involved in cell wall biosynthesis
VTLDEFRTWTRSGAFVAALGRYATARILVPRLESAGRPLPLAMAARFVSRGPVTIEDAAGRRRVLDLATLTRWTLALATEPFWVGRLLRDAGQTVSALERDGRRASRPLDLDAVPVYLRTDLSFGVKAGGSVGHIAGVLNALARRGPPPIFVSTDAVTTLDASVQTHMLTAPEAFWNFRELPTLPLNDAVSSAAEEAIGARPIAFVYQRYSLNSYAGLRLARARGVPFALEYNGSEIWMARHWGRPLKYASIADRIERLNLRAADLVVVVSQPMRDDVVERGADPARVLMNPNGVDADAYSPAVDGSIVRHRFGIDDKIVVGFIGTFGPWHGAEVLAESFALLLSDRPEWRSRVRLLLIGDGARMPATRAILQRGGVLDAVVCTGLIAQERGPEFLAACDLFVSPHVANPDGTPFFGSPTKLFEYMAMAKGIVASNLDQIGEVLEHGRTAWLVPPGDVRALADGVARLIDDQPLCAALGAAARRVALSRFTWDQHVARTVDRLRALSVPPMRAAAASE